MGVIKILGVIPKLSLNISFVASYSNKLIFTQSVRQKSAGYYFDSMLYRRYSISADAQHIDGKLRVLRVYRCAERLHRGRSGGMVEFLRFFSSIPTNVNTAYA